MNPMYRRGSAPVAIGALVMIAVSGINASDNLADTAEPFDELTTSLDRLLQDAGDEVARKYSGRFAKYEYAVTRVFARRTSPTTAKVGYKLDIKYIKLSKISGDVSPVTPQRNSLYLRHYDGVWTVDRAEIAHSPGGDADTLVAITQRIDALQKVKN